MNDEGRLIVINRFSLNMLEDLKARVLFEETTEVEAIQCLRRFNPVWYINSPQIAAKLKEHGFKVVENKGYISLKKGERVMYININHRNGETTMLYSKVRIWRTKEPWWSFKKLGHTIGLGTTATS